jgi:hypothetical protein
MSNMSPQQGQETTTSAGQSSKATKQRSNVSTADKDPNESEEEFTARRAAFFGKDFETTSSTLTTYAKNSYPVPTPSRHSKGSMPLGKADTSTNASKTG